MIDLIRQFARSLCFVIALLCVACDRPEPQKTTRDILDPLQGDTWVYDVEVRSFLPASVPPLPASESDHVRRELLKNGEVVHYTETRVYLGPSTLENGENVRVFGIYLGDTLARHEYSQIEGSQIYSIGMREFYPEEADAVIIEPRVLLFDENHQGGERWELKIAGADGNPMSLRDIRCIGWEEMIVLDRNRQALHIEFVGPGFPSYLVRDLWLVPGLGIIKEELYRFSQNSLVLHERRILREKLIGAPKSD
jgi:hypothetical protein